MTKIGPTFFNELKAAGIGSDVPIGWFPDEGTLSFGPDVTDEQKALAESVLAGHDPTKQLPRAQYSFLEFMALFTQAEQIAIVGSADIQVKLFLLMASGATNIDMNDARVSGALDHLAGVGLLADGRKAQIVDGNLPS